MSARTPFIAIWNALLLVACLAFSAATTAHPLTDCNAEIVAVQAAREAPESEGQRPTTGWETVSLPDSWSQRWPRHDGSVWYRIDWQRDTAADCLDAPVALAVDRINMTGELFVGDTLLWRDAHLHEPLSRSWNMPRQWLLPVSLVGGATPSIWVRVIGLPSQSSGLGPVHLGDPAAIAAHQAQQHWEWRTVFFINLMISAIAACIFAFIWLFHRGQRAYGWFALTNLFWSLFIVNMLATSPWPFSDTLTLARANACALLLHVLCFIQFIRHFGALDGAADAAAARPDSPVTVLLGLVLKVAWPAVIVLAALVWLAGPYQLELALAAVGVLCTLLYVCSCLWGVARHWRGPRVEDRLLAACLLIFLGVCIHGWLVNANIRPNDPTLIGYVAVITSLVMAALMGLRIARNTQRIALFSDELRGAVATAQTELRSNLQREHALALDNTRLQERLAIAHDLHDGLGATLVRSMALVEQSDDALPPAQMLSILKLLRDDLGQLIDTSASPGLSAPETPIDWGAPVRNRFIPLFDELGIACDWHTPPLWSGAVPPAAYCLTLMRVLEEALTNVLKHSHAQKVCVHLSQPDAWTLVLRVEDDGVGLNVDSVLRGGLSIGMSSMQTRVERVFGTLQLRSRPGQTCVEVRLPLPGQPA